MVAEVKVEDKAKKKATGNSQNGSFSCDSIYTGVGGGRQRECRVGRKSEEAGDREEQRNDEIVSSCSLHSREELLSDQKDLGPAWERRKSLKQGGLLFLHPTCLVYFRTVLTSLFSLG